MFFCQKIISENIMGSKIKEYIYNTYHKLMNNQNLVNDNSQDTYLDAMRIDNIVQNYLSPSKFFHSSMGDPLIDVLNKYGEALGFAKDNIPVEEITLKKLGVIFEAKVVALIGQMAIPQIEIIGQTFGDKFIKTFQAMEKGIPIIYQGALIDHHHKIKGYADILIRSDFLNYLKPNTISPSEATVGSRFGSNWHYRVIDIKMSTLKQTKDQIHLQNGGLIKQYKIQLLAYNYALYQMQSYFPPVGYLLGRGAKASSSGASPISNCFDSISQVSFTNYDLQSTGKFARSLRWLTFLQNSHLSDFDFINWNTRIMNYIRPNMKNSFDTPWRTAKQKIAEYIGEHTLLPSVTVEQREKAIQAGQLTWWAYNPGSANNNLRNKTIKQVIHVNRNPSCLILPNQLDTQYLDYLPSENEAFITLDFETTNNLIDDFSTLPVTHSNELIFLIGISVFDPTGQMTHNKQFLINRLDTYSEKLMMIDFLDWFLILKNQFGHYPIVYHWGHAEKSILERFYQRHQGSFNVHYDTLFGDLDGQLLDLLDIFKKAPITIKGSFGFGLKEVSKALLNLGLIQADWNQDDDVNGFSSMFKVAELNQLAIAEGKTIGDYPECQSLMYYNQVDCQVVVEIIKFLENRYKQNL